MILSFLLFPVINIWTDRKKTAYAAATIGLSGHCEKISLNWNSDCDYRTPITTSILRWWILLVEFPLPFCWKSHYQLYNILQNPDFGQGKLPAERPTSCADSAGKLHEHQYSIIYFQPIIDRLVTKPIHQSDILSVCINFINKFDTVLFIEINKNVILLNRTGSIDAREWWIYLGPQNLYHFSWKIFN